MHYLRGKADWMLRGLPCDPAPSMREKLRALPYFINNLAPGIRANWIAISRRPTRRENAARTICRACAPADPVMASALRTDVVAVVLNPDGVLLGAIEQNGKVRAPSLDAINPAPQTIRPDMTHRLAARATRKSSLHPGHDILRKVSRPL